MMALNEIEQSLPILLIHRIVLLDRTARTGQDLALTPTSTFSTIKPASLARNAEALTIAAA